MRAPMMLSDEPLKHSAFIQTNSPSISFDHHFVNDCLPGIGFNADYQQLVGENILTSPRGSPLATPRVHCKLWNRKTKCDAFRSKPKRCVRRKVQTEIRPERREIRHGSFVEELTN